MSDSKSFSLEIITPEKTVYQGSVSSVTCPGSEGLFQVLVNHAPLLSSLTVGRCTIVEDAGTTVHLAISGGFVQVLHNAVLMLADTAERREDIDRERAEQARQRAEERLHAKDPSIDVERARMALLRSLNRLRVVETN